MNLAVLNEFSGIKCIFRNKDTNNYDGYYLLEY